MHDIQHHPKRHHLKREFHTSFGSSLGYLSVNQCNPRSHFPFNSSLQLIILYYFGNCIASNLFHLVFCSLLSTHTMKSCGEVEHFVHSIESWS